MKMFTNKKDKNLNKYKYDYTKKLWCTLLGLYFLYTIFFIVYSIDAFDWFASCSAIESSPELVECRINAIFWIGPPALLTYMRPFVKNLPLMVTFLFPLYTAFTFGIFFNLKKVIFKKTKGWRVLFRFFAILLLWFVGGMFSGVLLT
jgi:hypothetical protein